MASIEIFEDEAFSVPALTAAINDQPYLPGRLAELGLFEEEGISSLVVQIEYDGQEIGLVSAKPRGGVGDAVTLAGRRLLPVNTVHLPERSTMLADEIQGIRAFGGTSELATAQGRVIKYLTKHRSQLDLTHEYHRIGAINGKVLDADGETVLLDIYQIFGIQKTTVSMALSAANTVVRSKCGEVMDKMEGALGAIPLRGGRALCGKGFWDKLINHKSVRETYLNTSQAAELRGKASESFEFGGITWERYRGSMNKGPFIPDNEARAFPDGVPGLFITRFAPADYIDTVNTDGLPYYSSVERLRHGKGVEIESQSNPLHIPTRPQTIIHLTAD